MDDARLLHLITMICFVITIAAFVQRIAAIWWAKRLQPPDGPQLDDYEYLYLDNQDKQRWVVSGALIQLQQLGLIQKDGEWYSSKPDAPPPGIELHPLARAVAQVLAERVETGPLDLYQIMESSLVRRQVRGIRRGLVRRGLLYSRWVAALHEHFTLISTLSPMFLVVAGFIYYLDGRPEAGPMMLTAGVTVVIGTVLIFTGDDHSMPRATHEALRRRREDPDGHHW
ncbi:TIGR04222 domain-containing membrane protein [Nonomuraea sp. NN258]|uniref:TIGR04222 domain-containing membrane protein n=1 Tax=Nonomuraea antri TaxID=2730852 RepID=UPI0015697397|nr:TIGR04222 domain-containing membrane protein [Nonomuraea antri]NRQ35404.1 TIGR04222 domain-containing membrane protein [Nonomuraea antri]